MYEKLFSFFLYEKLFLKKAWSMMGDSLPSNHQHGFTLIMAQIQPQQNYLHLLSGL
jgi:hypothetical protein